MGDRPPLPAFYALHRARVYALLVKLEPANGARYADLAMAGLESSARGGLKNLGQRLQGDAFASLRDREDFKKLLRETSQPKNETISKPQG